MDISWEESKNEKNTLTEEEGVKLLWEWRKYRNQVFWTSMYRWGAIVLLLTIIPYLLPDLIRKLGLAIFIFPVLACLLSIFASYLMIVQYMLYKQTRIQVKKGSSNISPKDLIRQVTKNYSRWDRIRFYNW